MKPSHSNRDELPEPLRSLVDDIANAPVPESLLESARRISVSPLEKSRPGRSGLVVAVSVLALGVCLAALLVRERPADQAAREIVKKEQPASVGPKDEMPPPTFWAYRRAYSEEALDELLSEHAAVLLPATPRNEFSLFPSHIRKEEL